MPTLTAIRSRYVQSGSPNTTFSGTPAVFNYSHDEAFVQFQAPATEDQFKKVSRIVLHLFLQNNYPASSSDVSYAIHTYGNALVYPFPDDVTYNTKKTESSARSSTSSGMIMPRSSGWVTCEFPKDSYSSADFTGRLALRHGVGIHLSILSGAAYGGSTVDVVGSANAPYIDVTFSSETAKKEISSVSPTTGTYIPKYAENTFSWGTKDSGYCYGELEVVSSKLRWKTSESGTVYEVSCGTDLSYTFPANVFSTDTVIWQAEITDNAGNTSTSEWQTLTTAEVTPDAAVIVAPKNTMEDGSQPIVFRWQHVISTGTQQGAAEIQKSINGSTWTSLATITGNANTLTVSAGTFSSGENYWRVRTANTDGTYGAWSDAASFLVVSAPPMPNVSTDNRARPTVSWQSSDQQGYRVQIGDLYDSGVMYGQATSLTVPMYLPNGSYVASVAVVNNYGLWSEYGTAPLNVTAASTGDVVLTATSGNAVQLSWTATTYADGMFLVYRDGKQIAVTTETTYTDNLTAGTHVYIVRQYRTSNNNATSLSNEVTATAHVDMLTIIDTETGEPMLLTYSSMQYRDEMETKSMDMTLFHFSGAEYPVPEKSSFANKAISFRTAFMDLAEAAQFERFYKKTVCVKTPKDNVVIGVFAAYTKTESRFFVGYDFTIQQIHFSEVVNL